MHHTVLWGEMVQDSLLGIHQVRCPVHAVSSFRAACKCPNSGRLWTLVCDFKGTNYACFGKSTCSTWALENELVELSLRGESRYNALRHSMPPFQKTGINQTAMEAGEHEGRPIRMLPGAVNPARTPLKTGNLGWLLSMWASVFSSVKWVMEPRNLLVLFSEPCRGRGNT